MRDILTNQKTDGEKPLDVHHNAHCVCVLPFRPQGHQDVPRLDFLYINQSMAKYQSATTSPSAHEEKGTKKSGGNNQQT